MAYSRVRLYNALKIHASLIMRVKLHLLQWGPGFHVDQERGWSVQEVGSFGHHILLVGHIRYVLGETGDNSRKNLKEYPSYPLKLLQNRIFKSLVPKPNDVA